jgi:protein arginine N-methyltransferase 1
MYTLADHASMMADVTRVDAYAKALQRAVHPDSIVADIGAGIGTFTLLAARFGARTIYAIEPDDAIHVGRAIAEASGLADRIRFMQSRSTDVTLPERATIIVSDMHGALPFFERHVPAITDARDRLLAKDGVLIPRRDHLWAAIVDAPDLYADHVAPWRDRTHGLDFRSATEMLTNTWRRTRVAPDVLISDAKCLATLDYRDISSPDLDAEATWSAARPGTAHGLGVWFDSELVDGVSLSNAPDQPRALHAQAFFPFAAPVPLGTGESISVRLQATLLGDDYMWRWTSRGRMQSTLYGVPLGVQQLAKGAAEHVPVLTTEGEVDLFVLARMQDSMPVEEIANALLARFPSAFRDRPAALGRAGDLARRYSKG